MGNKTAFSAESLSKQIDLSSMDVDGTHTTIPMFTHCHVHARIQPDTLLAMCGRVPELPVVAWPEKSDAPNCDSPRKMGD